VESAARPRVIHAGARAPIAPPKGRVETNDLDSCVRGRHVSSGAVTEDRVESAPEDHECVCDEREEPLGGAREGPRSAMTDQPSHDERPLPSE
jgi:hypothetical protein